MNFGFSSSNISGFVQIDGSFSNYAMVLEGVARVSTQTSPTEIDYPFGVINFGTVFASPPIVLVRPPMGQYICGEVYKDGFIARSPSKYWSNPETPGIQENYFFEYAVYVPINPLTPNGDYGMIVNNANSSRVFDSRLPYFSVDAKISFQLNSSPFTFTVPPIESGRRFFSLNGLSSQREVMSAPWNLRTARYAAWLSDTQIRTTNAIQNAFFDDSPYNVLQFDGGIFLFSAWKN